jgi:hypothetical protein
VTFVQASTEAVTHPLSLQVWPALHALPHIPQSVNDVWRSSQPSVHRVKPLSQVVTHSPMEQVTEDAFAVGQTNPQKPQLAGSVLRFAQPPLQDV